MTKDDLIKENAKLKEVIYFYANPTNLEHEKGSRARELLGMKYYPGTWPDLEQWYTPERCIEIRDLMELDRKIS